MYEVYVEIRIIIFLKVSWTELISCHSNVGWSELLEQAIEHLEVIIIGVIFSEAEVNSSRTSTV